MADQTVMRRDYCNTQKLSAPEFSLKQTTLISWETLHSFLETFAYRNISLLQSDADGSGDL